MRLRLAGLLLSCLALAACQGLGSRGGPPPPQAFVSGSHFDDDSGTIDTFRVTGIDGRPVGRFDDPSRTLGVDARHAIDAGRTVRVDFEGLRRFTNPLRSLVWDPQRVEGSVEFVPQPEGRYVVRGKIDAQGSTVWLEDARTQEAISPRFTAGPAAPPVLRENNM